MRAIVRNCRQRCINKRHWFPNSAWEPAPGNSVSRILLSCGTLTRNGVSRRCVPKRSLGTRGESSFLRKHELADQLQIAAAEAPHLLRHDRKCHDHLLALRADDQVEVL